MGADKLVPLVPKVLSVILSVSVTLGCSQMSAFAKNDNSPLSEVEQRLFFKTYSEETNDERLERLEKRVFGTVMTGSFEERLSKVSVASQPQVNPDGSMTGSVQQSDTSTAGNTTAVPQKSAAQVQEEERQAAADRAKVAAQAAKEEEADHALADGTELWRAKRGPEALSKFQQVMRLTPNNPQAYFSAGIIYESTNNLPEALSNYQRAAEIRPDNPDFTDAVKAVQKKMSAAANISPKQAEINRLTEQANAAYKRQEYLSALDLYKQLDFVNPNQALVKYNIGTLYLQIKDPFTALQYYKQAATLNPKEQKYVTAYQKVQAGVNKEEAAQEASNAQWTNAGYDLAHIGENPPNQSNGQNAPQQNNQGNFRRPVLNMGQQASQQNSNNQNNRNFNNGSGMQQQMPQQMQQQQAPMQTTAMNPPQGFIPSEQTQFPPTGAKPASTAKTTAKAKSQQTAKPKPQQLASQQMPQQMPMQMQQQIQQNMQQQQQPMQQQNFNNNGGNQGIDPAAAREMQAVLQQNMQQGNIPGNFGGQQNQSPPPQQNQQANVPANNYRPGFTPAPGNQSSSNPATKTPAKNAAQPGNNKFGFEPPPPDAAATYGIIAGASKEGIRATEVGIGSRASRAGLRRGDLIRAIDGTVLRSVQQLNDTLNKKNGGSVQLYVQRNSQMATLTL